MSDQRLILPDHWQQVALAALRRGEDVVVQAPTGAGKTHVFELLVESGHRGQAVYTVPTRALANDKRAEWQAAGWDVGIATGDLSENLGAPVVVATLETQRHRFLEDQHPDLLVVDEYQMIADLRRGAAYETVLALAPKATQLLLLSGSIANPKATAEWLRSLGRTVTLVEEHRRPVPLEEVWLDALETKEPEGVRSPIARAVIKGILADLGPILVFAPRRRAAEQIARDIAHGLPMGNGPQLSPAQRDMAGEDLYRLLRQGVGLHHSGLTYEQRSLLIEPWAKSGRLKVVVATTGLAAGINFSLRSVLVTDRRYATDHAEREVRPDELLQMFGRAGRRGLDEKGFALWSGDSPRLGEAKPLQLKRSEGLDWPAFLALMHRAKNPQAAAQKLAASLFTREPVQLALDQLTLPEVATAPALPVVIREIEEMCGRNGIWQRLRPTKVVPLTEAFILVKDAWHPALTKPDSLRGVAIGTPCRLPMADGSVRHGRAVPLAHFPKTGASDRLEPADWLRKALLKQEGPRGPRRQWKLETLEKEILPLLPKLTQGGQAFGEPYVLRDTVQVRLDYSKANVRVTPDADEQPLINPLRRKVQKEDIHLGTVLGGGHISAARAGRLWLKLGLIDADARPTRRGEIAALFQHGEGLAVAAALEDEGYDVHDLAWDLAELRAGERVAAGGRSSSRLGACCRLTYKSLTAEGYLRDGLPESFGEGCAEVLRGFVLHGKLPPPDAEGRGPGTGDLERAILEWRSTLRLIAHGAAHPWERWRALSVAAREVLAKVGPKKA
jgi:superfamily II DNA/RNA helicase